MGGLGMSFNVVTALPRKMGRGRSNMKSSSGMENLELRMDERELNQCGRGVGMPAGLPTVRVILQVQR